MSIAERLREARQRKGVSQSDLARRLGVTRGACGQWERGSSAPSVDNLARLAVVLEVRFEWLATGRGGRDYGDAVQEEPPLEYARLAALTGLAADERELLTLYARLPAGGRERLIDLLRSLTTDAP